MIANRNFGMICRGRACVSGGAGKGELRKQQDPSCKLKLAN